MPDAQGNPLPGEAGYVEPVEALVNPNTVPNTPVPSTGGDIGEGYKETALAVEGREQPDFAGYENPALAIDDIGVDAGEKYMTPETTVAGQLERLLDKGGALQQQSQVRQRERASALGMMSSSAAVGAARRADVEALLPVAAQDAKTAASFKAAQQATENQINTIQTEAEVSGALTQQKADIADQQNNIQRAWESTIKGLDADAQVTMTNLQGEWGERMKNLEADVTRELQQQEIDAGVEQTIINQANEAMNNYQITIQNLLANESFLDNFAGNSEAMRTYFDELFVTVESSIKYSAKAAGVYEDLSPYIDELVADNQWV